MVAALTTAVDQQLTPSFKRKAAAAAVKSTHVETVLLPVRATFAVALPVSSRRRHAARPGDPAPRRRQRHAGSDRSPEPGMLSADPLRPDRRPRHTARDPQRPGIGDRHVRPAVHRPRHRQGRVLVSEKPVVAVKSPASRQHCYWSAPRSCPRCRSACRRSTRTCPFFADPAPRIQLQRCRRSCRTVDGDARRRHDLFCRRGGHVRVAADAQRCRR